MNERIEKLKESACPKIDWAARYHVELNNGEKEKWMNEWFEKFAELIVKECASQVRFTDLLKCNDDSDGEILLQASVQLKQHFGVEE